MKIACIFGTRPEAIKMAPVVLALQQEKEWETKIIVTAQHRQMLDQVLTLFHLVPDYDLNIMKKKQSLEEVTSRALLGLSRIFDQEKPDLVLVHGDTTTTLCGALAAFYKNIPVGHVEAGLRTYNKRSPYPEEINRSLVGVMADLHFAPTSVARDNLLAEGVRHETIFVTGNTVIDALLKVADKRLDVREIPGLKGLHPHKKILLVTSHRRENLGEKMEDIFRAVGDLARDFYEDIQVVFPMHLNPAVRRIALPYLQKKDNIFLIEPLDYLPFVSLMSASYLILSDSGGIQEEAPGLGIPVLVLRDTTERPEAVEAGTVILAGTSYEEVYNNAQRLLLDEASYHQMSQAKNPYGDGTAARKIVRILHEYLQKH